MPEDPGDHDLMSEIMKLATESGEGTPTNRVRELYAKLISIFEDQKNYLIVIFAIIQRKRYRLATRNGLVMTMIDAS